MRTFSRPAQPDAMFLLSTTLPNLHLTIYDRGYLFLVEWQENNNLVDATQELIASQSALEDRMDAPVEVTNQAHILFRPALGFRLGDNSAQVWGLFLDFV